MSRTILSLIMMILCFYCYVETSKMAKILQRPIRSMGFPDNSNMGIFFAISMPLDEPYNSISLSYFFEANYNLPVNYSLSQNNLVDSNNNKSSDEGRSYKSIDRTTIYAILSNKFESAGFPGHECLLRSICEASEYPLDHNGVLGDVLQVVFAPSSSRVEDLLSNDIFEAESKGHNGSCIDYQSSCSLSIFDAIGLFL